MDTIEGRRTVEATTFREATAEDWEYVTKLGREAIQKNAGRPDRKSTRLNSSHSQQSRMPSSA